MWRNGIISVSAYGIGINVAWRNGVMAAMAYQWHQ
jgi:hypothetical protein